ncbi:putative phage abortive infection protein [Vibrio crassostreae]|nr:putative phage abortive infection protein [Vibrio crassostreae]
MGMVQECKFIYKGFEVEVQPNGEERYLARVLNDTIKPCEHEVNRSTEDEVLMAVKDVIDQYYLECKKYIPLEVSVTSRVYWFLGVVGLIWVAFIGLYYYFNVPIDVKSAVGTSSFLVSYSTFFNNFSAPLVALVSFFALLWTIFQQQKTHNVSLEELRLTRLEVEMTRSEMARATEAHKGQEKALKEQVQQARIAADAQAKVADAQLKSAAIKQFESTFYSLFEIHNNKLDSLRETKFFRSRIVNKDDAEVCNIRVLHNELLSDTEASSYFRTLYQLLKFIAKNHPSNDSRDFSVELLSQTVSSEEKAYTSLVRSTLTNDVLLALAINCYVGSKENHSFRNYFLLTERYSLLEHLDMDKRISYYSAKRYHMALPNIYETIIKNYSPIAFDKSESLARLLNKINQQWNDVGAVYSSAIQRSDEVNGSVFCEIRKVNSLS